MVKWHDVCENVKLALKNDGFDLVAPFRLSQYNALFDTRDAGNSSVKITTPRKIVCASSSATPNDCGRYSKTITKRTSVRNLMPREEKNPLDFYVKKKIDRFVSPIL